MAVLKMKSMHLVDLRDNFYLGQVKLDHRISAYKTESEHISISHTIKNKESTFRTHRCN